MYNTMGLTRSLSLTKIIGGISKTLQIANQVIPLYQKAKPVIKNARNIFGIIKEFKATETNNSKEENTKKKETQKIENKEIDNIKKESTTTPTFFL